MNIEEQWKNLESGQDEDLSGMLTMPAIKKLPSKDPLAILKKNLLINSAWGILTGSVYIIVLTRFPFWQLFLCFGIVCLFTGWVIFENIALYRTLTVSSAGKSMLEEMERHYYSIKKWMRIQEKTWLFIFPVIIIGSSMLGGVIGSGKPLDAIIQNRVVIIGTLVSLVVLFPLCYYLAKFMNRKAFGQYIEQLGDNIRALKEGE